MALSDVETIVGRVSAATPESPLAVFHSAFPDKLEAVFASTVRGQARLAARDPMLIGLFDNTMPRSDVRSLLQSRLLTQRKAA